MATAQRVPASNKPTGRAYKPKKCVKPQAVQSAILVKRANGDSKLKISKDLGISRNTVISVLDLNNFDEILQSEQKESLSLIAGARKAVAHRLSLNDGNIGIKVLENTIWPLNAKQSKAQDPSLVLAIQNLMGNVTVTSASSETPAQTQAISDAPLPSDSANEAKK
jgi:hypothetical protein